MNFEQLKQRVERREMLLDGRVTQTRMAYATLRDTWREAWTPGRIVVAGLLSGFIAGRSQPTRVIKRIGAIGGPQGIRMISALSGLFASLQAASAAATAKDAADTADDAAVTADAAAASTGATAQGPIEPGDAAIEADPSATTSLPSDRRRRVEPGWDAPPHPAEAATDVSER